LGVGQSGGGGFHTYTNITLKDFVGGLLKANLKSHREKVIYSDNLGKPTTSRDRRIRVADILREINRFLANRKKMMVVSRIRRFLVRRSRY
jgi:hypothetical protein